MLNLSQLSMIRSILSDNLFLIKQAIMRKENFKIEDVITFLNEAAGYLPDDKAVKNYLEFVTKKENISKIKFFPDLDKYKITISAILNPNFFILDAIHVINSARSPDLKITPENFDEIKEDLKEAAKYIFGNLIFKDKMLAPWKKNITMISGLENEEISLVVRDMFAAAEKIEQEKASSNVKAGDNNYKLSFYY